MKTSFKLIIGNIIVCLFTLTIGFAFSEVILRVRNADQKNYNIEMWRYAKELKKRSEDPELGHEHRPNTHAKLQNVEIRINSLGMRGPEPEFKDGQKRVMLLGSSNTLGWGVSENEIMAAYLQEGLGSNSIVLNTGIGNYNSHRYVKLFEKQFLQLKPDIVVVHYFLRDAEHLSSEGGNFLLRNSELAVVLFHLFHEFISGRKTQNLIDHYKNAYSENAQGYQEMQKALAHLNELAQTNHFKVVLAMVPDIHAITPYPFTFIHTLMRSISAQYGWGFVDFYEPLSKVPQQELWAMPGDPHINQKGQKIMADALLPLLQ